ncbi:MAG: hypothetical protein NC293_07630 [Roseburia sp.]|nr:hypothetical protein [Roseburia sp.]
MNLEQLIYSRFANSEQLTRNLAVFKGCPAVFSPEPPDPILWEGEKQYPQIVYNFDMQADEERKSVGTLAVTLVCQNTTDVAPEVIEPEVKKCLRDVLIKPESDSLYAFTWARTDAFSVQEKKNGLLIGSEIRFDILEYPNQQTTDPDPVMAANRYIKEMYPKCLVIGLDRLDEITEATKEVPVVYCRLITIDKNRETNTVAWMDGKLAVHVLCPDGEIRIKMATAIANQLSLDGEIIMLDDSPMFVKRLQVNYKSDYLKDGQVFITVHYGLLRYRQKRHHISGVGITGNFS